MLIAKQLSRETSSLMVTLFRDYFANDKQKRHLKEILLCNNKKLEVEKRIKYNKR